MPLFTKVLSKTSVLINYDHMVFICESVRAFLWGS